MLQQAHPMSKSYTFKSQELCFGEDKEETGWVHRVSGRGEAATRRCWRSGRRRGLVGGATMAASARSGRRGDDGGGGATEQAMSG